MGYAPTGGAYPQGEPQGSYRALDYNPLWLPKQQGGSHDAKASFSGPSLVH